MIDVHGGVQKSGSPSFSPAPVTGAAVVADPLASLPLPSTSGLTNYGAEKLSGDSSATIKPGIYSSISVSGSASLTMSSGTYIIEGGGFSVSGAGSVTGSGVTIVNAGSDYPSTGGTYGSISLSGSGTYKLTPPTTGTYAGIVIFQTRDNTKAMTVSGAASGMTGTIYAAAAALTISGSGAAQRGARRRHPDAQRRRRRQCRHAQLAVRHGRLHAQPDPRRVRHQQPGGTTAPARPSPSSMPTTTPISFRPSMRSTPSSA